MGVVESLRSCSLRSVGSCLSMMLSTLSMSVCSSSSHKPVMLSLPVSMLFTSSTITAHTIETTTTLNPVAGEMQNLIFVTYLITTIKKPIETVVVAKREKP